MIAESRKKGLIQAVLDEVIDPYNIDNYPKVKVGDNVDVIRGSLTGYSGTITFLSPDKTLADVEFENGRVGRVGVGFLKKKTKKKKSKKGKKK